MLNINHSKLKNILDYLMLESGLLEIFRYGYRNKASILMYHRVPGSPFSAGGFCFNVFEKQINYLVKHYNIISLEELVTHLKNGRSLPNNAVTITFDDGYVDNYLYAYPILKKYNAPASIFLSTNFIETKQLLPIDRIEYIVTKTEKKYLDIVLPNNTTPDEGPCRIELDADLEFIVKKIDKITKDNNLSLVELEKFTEDLALQQKVKIPDSVNQERFSPLSWSQVREMMKNGITFGSHTCSHPTLPRLPFEERRSEIINSRKVLEKQLDMDIDYFCYPYGAFNDVDDKILKELNFKAAVSTLEGLNDFSTDFFRLKRYSGEYTLPQLARRTSGFNLFKNS